MNTNTLNTVWKRMVVCAFWLGCVFFQQPGWADKGDSPLEAVFLPHLTELKGRIGGEYASDYYKVVVPATGRLILRLYDIHLNDRWENFHMSLFRTTRNSVGTGYTTYRNYVAESKNDYKIPEVIDIPDLAGGVYFVEVTPARNGQWDGGDYNVHHQ